MKIAFVHFPGRLARLDAARAGEAPTEFLFGALELERDGHEVQHYEVDPNASSSALARRVVDLNAGRGHLPPHLSAAVLSGTRPLAPRLHEAEVVVATTTATAMALAFWSRVGLFRRPLVGIVAGLLNHPWRRGRRLTTLPLLRRFHSALYGAGELPGLLSLDARLAERLHVIPFGVDTSFWTPVSAPRHGILAIGNDGHRDWDTLIRAAPHIDAPIRILTRHEPPAQLPPNVAWEPADWHRQLWSDAEIRDFFRTAAVVVVPVRDVPQPSGQSVTLQAMACGTPVVLSRTRGLWAPETLRDGDNVILVRPEDSDELGRSVNAVLEDKSRAQAIGASARGSVERDAPVEEYARRLLEVCREALARP